MSSRTDERRCILDAVIQLAGSRGFAQISLRQVLSACDTHSRAFRRHFDSLDDAFAAAYELCAEELVEGILAAGRDDEDWLVNYRSAVGFLIDWVRIEPDKARLLMVEYRGAGSQVVEIHERACKRLARAVDSGRKRLGEADQPPELTADFVVGGIESAIAERLRLGNAFAARELMPGFIYLGALLYLGSDAADRELRQDGSLDGYGGPGD